jgi:hypothetical protein
MMPMTAYFQVIRLAYATLWGFAEHLEFLNINIVGRAPASPVYGGIMIVGLDDEHLLIVSATPYLRDHYIRTAEAGEGIEDKEKQAVLDADVKQWDDASLVE